MRGPSNGCSGNQMSRSPAKQIAGSRAELRLATWHTQHNSRSRAPMGCTGGRGGSRGRASVEPRRLAGQISATTSCTSTTTEPNADLADI